MYHISRWVARSALAGLFAAALGAGAMVAVTQTKSSHDPSLAGAGKSQPVLVRKESQDVDGDGTPDVVAYFAEKEGGSVVAEAIDLGSDGIADVYAIRTDADKDGRADDWVVVNARTEEVRATLIDTDGDGDVDTIAFADGRRETIPAAMRRKGIGAVFGF